MATILDVAKLAGVSQGTVSNVLNNKGNVSAKKIQAVEEAAKELGFTINERAKMLRKGSTNLISVILPNLEFSHYRDFYNSFKLNVEKRRYSTEVLISNDNPQTEIELIQKAKSAMAEGIITFTCLDEAEQEYKKSGINKVIFIERKPKFSAEYYGFEYDKAGEELAHYIAERKVHNLVLVTSSENFSNERVFIEAFRKVLEKTEAVVLTHVVTDAFRISNSILDIFISSDKIDAIITTSKGFADKIHEIQSSMFSNRYCDIVTLSPVYSLPEKNFIKYELNYSLLGKHVADRIVESVNQKSWGKEHIYKNDGIRRWNHIKLKEKQAKCLNVLTIDSPEALAMKGLAQLYTEKTGTEIKVVVLSYDEIYEQLNSANEMQLFDIFRIDMTWISWFADKTLRPLNEIDPEVGNVFEEYIPTLEKKYSIVNDMIYALPTSPSSQMLFYRKDLFENVAIQRVFSEKFGKKLKVPKNFVEYNQIAKFFTELTNELHDVPVKYGTTLTWGNTGVAATEFLTRYFSHKKNLYNKEGKIVLNDEIGMIAMDELMEIVPYTEGIQTSWWTTSAKAFANGDVAMSIMFSNYASEILGSKSKIVDKIGFSMVPGGNPVLGGGALAVAKTSKYPEDALEFIKWVTKEPVASAIAALGGVSPCRKTYDKYDIINTFPWLELTKECFAVSQTQRIPEGMNIPFDERQFLKILGMAVKGVALGLMEKEEALNQVQRMIEEEIL